jgi:hypothetical protein
MKNEIDIVKALASEIARKITKKTIFALQRMNYTLSGDDSGLTTVWDEICVQVQEEESYHWSIYDLTVRSLVDYDVSQLKHFERLALWIQTESYDDWESEKQDNEQFPAVFDGDIVDYLLAEFIYSEAMDWTNAKIRKYIDQKNQYDFD